MQGLETLFISGIKKRKGNLKEAVVAFSFIFRLDEESLFTNNFNVSLLPSSRRLPSVWHHRRGSDPEPSVLQTPGHSGTTCGPNRANYLTKNRAGQGISTQKTLTLHLRAYWMFALQGLQYHAIQTRCTLNLDVCCTLSDLWFHILSCENCKYVEGTHLLLHSADLFDFVYLRVLKDLFFQGWPEAAEPEAPVAALWKPPQRAAGDDSGTLHQEASCHCTPWSEHGTYLILICTPSGNLVTNNMYIFLAHCCFKCQLKVSVWKHLKSTT